MRDSHGLFDYESQSITKDRIKISEPTKLFRNENSIISSLSQPSYTSSPPFLSITKTQTGYHLSPEPGSDLWLVIDCNKSKSQIKGFTLSQGKTIKLGRMRYVVKSVCGFEDGSTPKPVNSFSHIPQSGEHRVCRICLIEEEDGEPLIAPCNCGGTMKFIHLSCFRRWIESRTAKKMSDNSLSYYVKSLTCEISRCPIPPSIVVQDQTVDLLNIPSVDPPYITLESSSSEKHEYSIHLISLNNKNNVRLGRGHDSDIRISDISVSRCHAVIRYTNGEFVLEDNSSKFGTLVEGKEIEVNKGNPVACVQVGRTLLVFRLSNTEADGPDNSIEETDEEQEQ